MDGGYDRFINLHLEHERSNEAGDEEGCTSPCGDDSGAVGGRGGRACARGTAGGRGGGTSADGRAASGGCEGCGDTKARLVSVGDASGKGGKGLLASGWGVDGTVHASLAVGLPGAEEPDGVGGLGYLEGEDADLARGGIVGHEWRSEAVLLGDGVELLRARVGKRALGDGVVTTVELEVY